MTTRPSSFMLAVVLLIAPSGSRAQIPDLSLSYFIPQAGLVTSPIEGSAAIQYLRACPNNDGGASLPNNARVKVVMRDANGSGISGMAANDIGVLFNGGTPQQGFSGVGADSVISNSQYNSLCPDLRYIPADAPTDQNGITYITFAGSTPGSPGVATRDFTRKWGHYDTEFPVYALGNKLSGRITVTAANGSYILRIKNFDLVGGLGLIQGAGERVTVEDFNTVSNNLFVDDALSYWRDFNSDGVVSNTDLNMLQAHLNHGCNIPNSP